MTEQEYLSRLEQALKHAKEEDRTEAIAFYRAYFEEGGIPTDTPEEAAKRVMEKTDESISSVPKSNFGLKLTIVILTFPFWIGFLVAWIGIVIAAWVVLIVVPIALAAGALGLIIPTILSLKTFLPMGILGFGYLLTAAGLCLLLWKPCLLGVIGIGKGNAWLWKTFCNWMKGEKTYEVA